MKKLGKNQLAFLNAVVEHGSFHLNCGWIWKNDSTGIRLADSLFNRGLLFTQERAFGRRYLTVYMPTKDARVALQLGKW